MRFQNGDDFLLENVVCDTFGYDRHDMGGIVDGNLFEKQPILLAVICISRLYSGRHNKEIGMFFNKWNTVFEFPEENEKYTCAQYINELYGLIHLLSQ